MSLRGPIVGGWPAGRRLRAIAGVTPWCPQVLGAAVIGLQAAKPQQFGCDDFRGERSAGSPGATPQRLPPTSISTSTEMLASNFSAAAAISPMLSRSSTQTAMRACRAPARPGRSSLPRPGDLVGHQHIVDAGSHQESPPR